MAWPPVDQFTASKKSSGVVCRASKVVASARKYSSSMPNEYSAVGTPRGLPERITTWPLSPLRLNFSPSRIARSNSMCLKPSLEKRRLPKPRVPFRAHFFLRLSKHVLYELLAIDASLPRSRLREDVPNEI